LDALEAGRFSERGVGTAKPPIDLRPDAVGVIPREGLALARGVALRLALILSGLSLLSFAVDD
jgi:hypothetical protein